MCRKGLLDISRGDGRQNRDLFMEEGEVPSVTNLEQKKVRGKS